MDRVTDEEFDMIPTGDLVAVLERRFDLLVVIGHRQKNSQPLIVEPVRFLRGESFAVIGLMEAVKTDVVFELFEGDEDDEDDE